MTCGARMGYFRVLEAPTGSSLEAFDPMIVRFGRKVVGTVYEQ